MSKGQEQENEIKKKIAEAHERGVCDSKGRTIPDSERRKPRPYFVVPEFTK